MWGLWFLTVACLAGGVVTEDWVDLPEVDELLARTQASLREEGKDTFPLEDVSETFTLDFFGQRRTGEFSAQEGVLSNVGTIQRLGLVSVSNISDHEKNIIVTFKFDPLSFSYRNYKLKYLSVNAGGGVRITRTNTVGTLNHTVKFEKSTYTCSTTGNFNDLGKISTEFTGKQVPNQFLPFVSSWILHQFSTNQKTDLLKTIVDAVAKNLEQDESLCKAIFEGSP